MHGRRTFLALGMQGVKRIKCTRVPAPEPRSHIFSTMTAKSVLAPVGLEVWRESLQRVGGFVSDTEISKIALVRSLSNTDS
jgi:hypothetical protein